MQRGLSRHSWWWMIGSCSLRTRRVVFKENHNKFCDAKRLFISARALGNLLRRLCKTVACDLSSLGFFPTGALFNGFPVTFELNLAKVTFVCWLIFPLFIFSTRGNLWRWILSSLQSWRYGRKTKEDIGLSININMHLSMVCPRMEEREGRGVRQFTIILPL